MLWNSPLANILKLESDYLEESMLKAYYIHHDESQIKIDGDGSNILCACDKNHTRLWRSKNKSQEALNEIGFLSKFNGIIVKDGTELYNSFGMFLSQCLVILLGI